MITTSTAPVAGASGRATPVVAPMQQVADEAAQRRSQDLHRQDVSASAETKSVGATALKVVAEAEPADKTRAYIADREKAMRARLSKEIAEAADQESAPVEITRGDEQKKTEALEPIDLLPPPATEVLAKGGRHSRTEARAEMFEAEARLRVSQRAAVGYASGKEALG